MRMEMRFLVTCHTLQEQVQRGTQIKINHPIASVQAAVLPVVS